MKTKFAKSVVDAAVKISFSIVETVKNLHINYNGSQHAKVRALIEHYGISTKHFKGQAWNKGRAFFVTRIKPAEYLIVFTGNAPTPHKIRLWILRDKIKPHKCESCGQTYWLGKLIPLELHHINGNKKDNRLENLMLLCCNCHACTDNWRGKPRK